MALQQPCAPDDRTLRYVVESRPLYDGLQQVLTQVAGFSLLVMTQGPKLPLLDEPAALARAAFGATRGRLDALPVPAGARHHNHHLREAADAIERVLAALFACLRHGAGEAEKAILARCLRLATDHLRAASRALPGFEMVDLTQACCAAHGTLAERRAEA